MSEKSRRAAMSLELPGTMLAQLHGALSTLVSSADLHWNLEVLEQLRPTLGQFPERTGGLPDRQGVVRIMEVLHEGVMVIDVAGATLYENPALQRIVAADPEGPMLKKECLVLAQRLLSMARRASQPPTTTEQTVRTTTAGYRIRGALVDPRMFALQPISLVVVARTTPEEIPREVLQNRYGLTPREALIAQQLAEGRNNGEIAQRLHISLHTVRRHVERVLSKLGVHSRAAVAAKLTADS